LKAKKLVLLLTVIIITFFSFLSKAQDSKGHLYEMNFLSIPYEQMDAFIKFYEDYGKPLDAQNEYVLSVKVFRHVFGPMWNICFVAEYKDFDSYAAGRKRGDELWEKMISDNSKRNDIEKQFASYLRNHTDALVMDNPNLEKK
jgi:hypothetical protein